MKTSSVKLTCLLLALLACGSSLLSCGGSGDTVGEQNTADPAVTETAAETEAPAALTLLPEADYGAHDYRILLLEEDDRYVDIMTEGMENGDIMNDLVFYRNRAVEEKYNITVTGERANPDVVNDTVRRQVSAGDSAYDLYFVKGCANNLAAEGYLHDLTVLPNVDLSQPWWDQTAVSGLSVGQHLYAATGDITPSSLLTSACLVFNKQLFENYDIEKPYDIARDGKWTIDYMNSLTRGLTTDVNADGAFDYRTDLFTLSSWYSDSAFSLFYGCGGTMSEKNAEDIPVISYNMDKFAQIYEKIYSLVIDSGSYFVTDRDLYETTYECFSAGNAFFCDITLQKIGLFLRDMKDDFGILPMPKLDESQNAYVAHVNGAAGFIVVPSNAPDAARTGMIVEALAASAYDMITPSLYEVIVKTKNVTDTESAEMVDLIIRNRVFDPYYMYTLSGFDFVKTQLDDRSKNISSTLEKNASRAEKDLAKIVDAYSSID